MLAVLIAVAAATVQADGDRELVELMAQMNESRGVVAEFIEDKHLALLSAPLRSHGRLYFAPPDALLRSTDKPSRTFLLIDGKIVRYRDEAGADRFDLSASSIARQFVENFMVLFKGDLNELRARYSVGFEQSGASWYLNLKPRRAPFDRMIESVVLEGEGRRLASIRMTEKDGDVTVTRITQIEADRVTTADELARLFGGE